MGTGVWFLRTNRIGGMGVVEIIEEGQLSIIGKPGHGQTVPGCFVKELMRT